MLRSQNWQMSKEMRAVLWYQAIVTLSIALIIGVAGGVHWGVSGMLGGLISMVAGLTYGVMTYRVGKSSAGNALVSMMRAESAKLLVIIMLLGLVFAGYEEVFGAGFIGTFIVTTLIFSLAIFIRNK